MRLARGQHEAKGTSCGIGNYARLRAIATTRATQRLACVALGRGGAMLHRPGRLVMGANAAVIEEDQAGLHFARSLRCSSRRGQTPSRLQRLKVCAARHQGPSSVGIWRHFAPLS